MTLQQNTFGFWDSTAINTDNILLDTDSYKHSHAALYPPQATNISSYIEARSAMGDLDTVTFFGLQYDLTKLVGLTVTQAMIDEAQPFLRAHGFDLELQMWQRIVDDMQGRLPVLIEAVPEGTRLPVGMAQMRIQATRPWAVPLVSFLETRLLRSVWFGSTVATVSGAIMADIRAARLNTDGSDEGAEFALHDFGARGASSRESTALGGVAHLVNSKGTDTLSALVAARNVYGAPMAGFSIPATEHSVMTALGRDGEMAQVERLLDANPAGLVACVLDSYDLFGFLDTKMPLLKDRLMARDGVFVVRPDSGDPVTIVPEVIERLMGLFGHQDTAKGYRLLPRQIRVIQGDGVNRDSVRAILNELARRKMSASNVAFGMGGALLQKVNRDNFGYAMKASAIEIDGTWRPIFKDPKTAQGTKTSKKGVQGVMRTDNGRYVARPAQNIPSGCDALTPVFRDGRLIRRDTLDIIRARAWPNAIGFSG